MTPGALTPAERRSAIEAWHWSALNPRMPDDPAARFVAATTTKPKEERRRAV